MAELTCKAATNKATLRVETGPLDHSSVVKALKDTVDQIREWLDDSILKPHAEKLSDMKFEVNVVTTISGDKYGHSFVHATPEALYYLLQGLCPNGSPYYEEVDDPSWVAEEVDFDESNFDLEGKSEDDVKANKLYTKWLEDEGHDPSKPSDRTDWTNQSDFEEYVTNRTTQRTLKVKCSLSTISRVQYSEDEKKIVAKRIEDSDEDIKTVPDSHTFCAVPAIVCPPTDPMIDPKTLKSVCPICVTEEMIFEMFSPFNTDPNTYSKAITGHGGARSFETYKYPIVRSTIKQSRFSENKERHVYIEFSGTPPHHTDAGFARIMRRQTKFSRSDSDPLELPVKANVVFDYLRNNKGGPREKSTKTGIAEFGKANGEARDPKFHGTGTKEKRPALAKPPRRGR